MNTKDSKLPEIWRDHLPYEIEMFMATFERLDHGMADSLLANALIESFCIHARILIDFFDGRNGVPARSFTDALYVPFEKGRIAEPLIKKLNTQIAHLTHERTSHATKKIDPHSRRKLFLAVVGELRNFEQRLKREFRDTWKYEQILSKIQQH